MAITLVGWYFINIFPSHIKLGTSLGKRNSKLVILDEEFKEVNIKTMYLREFFILICIFLTAGLYLIVSMYLLDKRIDKRAIHDLVFKTRVVRTTIFIGKTE